MTLLSHPSTNKNTKNPPSDTTTSASTFPISQIIPGCLYFSSFNTRNDTNIDKNVIMPPKNDAKTVYIDIDSHVHYDAFYDDFGPLNLAVLYRFCQSLHALVLQHNNPHNQQQKKRIFLYTSADPKCRVNAVFLVASYMIIYHHLTAEQAYLRLQCAEPPPFIGFRDAALGPPSYLLHVQHVIKSIEKAMKFKWLDFTCFDADEYEYFERVENGDLNWIVPGKLLSFCGPHDRSYVENGYPYHSPELYFDYFRAHNVTTVVRLNKKIYDAKRFTDAGFAHHDLFFIDGSTPTEEIVLRFLDVVDSATGAIAVHCKAGLGRTGCMIACWMMKHYRLTAPQCMGWLRVCRPGSVIGPQQQFLIEKQAWCWNLGKADGLRYSNRINWLELEEEEDDLVEHSGRKLLKTNTADRNNEQNFDAKIGTLTDNNNKILQQETALNEAGQSQGDRLCEIKARAQLRQQRHQSPTIDQGATTASPPTTSPSESSKFICPPPAAVCVDSEQSQRNTPMASAPMAEGKATTTAKANTDAIASNCFLSATTPIKQLKLSSTFGGHAPAFVKINSKQDTRPTHSSTMVRGTNESGIVVVSKRGNKPVDTQTTPASLKTTITPTINSQRSKNPIAVINRLPIQKVSVSSTGRQSHAVFHQSHLSSPSRAQLHRKHFSGATRLKPYHPSECETAHRYASELATTAQASAQNNYGKSLKKQYSAISAACQQQQRQKQQQQNQLTMLNNNCGNKGTLMPWTLAAMDGAGHCGTSAHKNNENNNNNIGGNNCKYDLRPRDQLHLPARFASEQPSLPPVSIANNSANNNNSGCILGPPGGTSPYLLTRLQKASKSTTTFFPTTSSSSRL